MAGLLEKARVALKANLHSLLDKVIDMNKIGVVKEYTRELEDALAQFEDADADAVSELRSANRELVELTHRADDLEHIVQLLVQNISTTQDATDQAKYRKAAERKQAELNQQNSLVGLKRQEITDATGTHEKLTTVIEALQSKHDQMVNQVHYLENLDRSTRVESHAAKAITDAEEVLASGVTGSVDNLTDKMRRDKDNADVKLERATDHFDTVEGKDVAMVTANAQIEERLRALKK